MTTITITLPKDTSPDVVDAITVAVHDHWKDRQPRHTYLEGIERRSETIVLTFTT